MKTHCKHGHEFTKDNTIWGVQDGNGKPRRTCRTCARASKRKSYSDPERRAAKIKYLKEYRKLP